MPHDEFGREIPDPTPVALPQGYQAPEPLNLIIQRIVKNELSRQAESEGLETFEEADDFEVLEDDSDLDFSSQYELVEMADDGQFSPGDASDLDGSGPSEAGSLAPEPSSPTDGSDVASAKQ